MVMKWRVLLTGVLALLSVSARAQQPELVIRQVSVHLPFITVYLDLPPESGAVPQFRDSDVSAVTIQGQNLKLESLNVSHAFAYTFLLDVSGSMRLRRDVLNAIGNWVDRLHPEDHVEIFAFGETFREIGASNSDKAALKSDLSTLHSGEQTTNLYYALDRGIASAERADPALPQARAIVLLTDGKNEGDNGGIDESKVRDDIRKSHVPINAIGHTRLGSGEQDIYLRKMKLFADESGGFYDCAGTLPSALCPPGASLEQSFERLSQRMNRMFVLQLRCDRCRNSDNHDLQITLKNKASGRISVPLAVLPEIVPPKAIPPWVYVAGAIFLLLVVLFILWLVFRKKPEPPKAPEVVAEVQAPLDAVAQSSGLPAHVTIVSGPEPGRVYHFKLGAKAVIGRDAGCNLALPGDNEISGHHCELTRKGKLVEIADLGSMNGTLLNGARVVAAHIVEDGDLIRVGRTEFRVRFGDSA
jgi:hypothetical protein